MKDHYRTLGVAENATDADIKLAYRRLAKRYHPDVNAGARGAEERFKEIVEAYNILSDPMLRRTYDMKRKRRELFGSGSTFVYSPQPAQEKKDPRRKTYSPEDLERAQRRHRGRAMAQMARRKKLLAGMIVTFIIYLFAAAAFQTWMEEKREEEAAALTRQLEERAQAELLKKRMTIENLDSPYDSLFGTEQDAWNSRNSIIFVNPHSDAVICAVQAEAPFRTVRNEFARAGVKFVMRRLPPGPYTIKVYTGENWDVNKKVNGKLLGGFTRNEEFFRIAIDTIVLNYAATDYPVKEEIRDTVVIDPTLLPFEPISREAFFQTGN